MGNYARLSPSRLKAVAMGPQLRWESHRSPEESAVHPALAHHASPFWATTWSQPRKDPEVTKRAGIARRRRRAMLSTIPASFSFGYACAATAKAEGRSLPGNSRGRDGRNGHHPVSELFPRKPGGRFSMKSRATPSAETRCCSDDSCHLPVRRWCSAGSGTHLLELGPACHGRSAPRPESQESRA